MKKSIISLFFVVCLAGCSNGYCFHDTKLAFQQIFVEQFHDGVKNTTENFRSIGSFVQKDIATSGGRLSSTLGEMYRGVNIVGTSKRLSYYSRFLGKQINKGLDTTGENFRAIGYWMCLHQK